MDAPMIHRFICRKLRREVTLAVFAPVLAAGVSQAATLRGPDGGEVRSLVIGIDTYKHVRPLKGAVADAQDIYSALKRNGVNDAVILPNAQVERVAGLREFARLVQRPRSNALVLLSIAGHGTQEPERVKGSQPDGMDSVFLLPSFEPNRAGSAQRVLGSEFNHYIKKLE